MEWSYDVEIGIPTRPSRGVNLCTGDICVRDEGYFYDGPDDILTSKSYPVDGGYHFG